MKHVRLHVVAATILAVGLGSACEFQRRSSTLGQSPTQPSSGSGSATPSYVGTWSSATVNELPSQLQGCANFQWQVTSQTETSISGTFSATCTGGIGVTGSGTGQLQGTTLAISIAGTATIGGSPCNVTLTGTGYYEGDRITVPYSGNSCFGPFSGVETLRRGSLPGPTNPPPPTTPPPTNAIPCAFNNGDQIVECVANRWPERLVAGVSLDERKANMMFLRDRIIEGGLCGGLDLGWNLKRGGPEISIDFLVWRRNGQDVGIDIAFDYDNTSNPLQLQWLEGTFPTYTPYPAPNCAG